MKCWGIFWGGSSYSSYITNRDVEEFSSIGSAKGVFWGRIDFDPYYPCVNEDEAEMQIFFNDPRTDEKPEALIDPGYPDRIIRMGPRGGVYSERC